MPPRPRRSRRISRWLHGIAYALVFLAFAWLASVAWQVWSDNGLWRVQREDVGDGFVVEVLGEYLDAPHPKTFIRLRHQGRDLIPTHYVESYGGPSEVRIHRRGDLVYATDGERPHVVLFICELPSGLHPDSRQQETTQNLIDKLAASTGDRGWVAP